MERFLEYFTPENYRLALTIDKHQETLTGRVIITGAAKQSQIKLHATDLNIDQVEVNGEPAKFTHNNKELTINAAKGNLTLEIAYHAKLNRNMQGAYLSTYQHKGREEYIVATQFESHYARQCFPCVDEPAAKATFDLAITIPEQDDDTILANTPVKSQKQNTTIFEQTPRMPTYLLAFVIGHFHSKATKSKHGVTVTSYCALNQNPDTLDFANHIAAESLDYYDDQFQVKYPLAKLDQVALPDFEAGAMENWGLVTYREICMLAEPDASTDTKESVATTIAHELSHQWFGNLVTMQWWDDLWLNESFANSIEYFAVDHIHPEYEVWRSFFTSDCVAALRRDALPGVQAVHQDVHDPEEINTLFDGAIVYAKGARLMVMLIRLMGYDNFLAGIRDYFAKHQYGNTTGDDLWAALQPHADFDVKDFMHAWINQPGYPVIKGVEQQRFFITGGTDDTKWPLPTVKDDMSGHYLINLKDDEFARKLNNFADLDTEQRLRLLLDRELLAKTPLVPSASLLDLLPHFAKTEDYSAWSILANIISDLKLFCPPETPAANALKAQIRPILPHLYDKLGPVPAADEPVATTSLRNYILGLGVYAEYPPIMDALYNIYTAANGDLRQIHPEIREVVLIAAMRQHEDEIFAKFADQYQQETDPVLKYELLYALTDARHQQNWQRLVTWLDQPDIVRPQDHIYLYIYLARNHYAKSAALSWLYGHWDYLEQMTGGKTIEDYPRLTAGVLRTRAEADEFYTFFDPLANVPVLKRTLAIAKPDIEARLQLLANDTASVHAKLGLK